MAAHAPLPMSIRPSPEVAGCKGTPVVDLAQSKVPIPDPVMRWVPGWVDNPQGRG